MPKPEVISIKSLSRSIDKAVLIAAKRHGVKPATGNLLVNWQIIGRMLRDLTDVETAFEVATEITKGVKLKGIAGEPAFAKIGRDILVGFIERANVPQLIGE